MRWITCLLLASAVWAQDVPLAEAEKKMAAGDFKGALVEFEKAIEAAPGDVRGHVGRARALRALGRNAEALAAMTKAIELASTPDAKLFQLRALFHFSDADYAAVIADCTKAIEIDASYARAYRLRADALGAKREDAAALKDYDKALELEPKDATTLHRRGQTKEALRDFKGALEDFTRLTELAHESPVPFALRGRVRIFLGDYKGALDDFDAAFYNEDQKEPERDLRVSCARARLGLGQKDEADAEAAKAGEPPAKADAFADRGRYYYDTGRPKEAAADLAKAVQMDPKGQDYARLFLFLARARLGERKEAAAELKAYADGREKRDDWYSHVASLLSGQSKEEEFFAAVKSENPQIAIEQECEASWYAGSVHLIDGDAAGAKPLFERCVKTDVRTFIEYESAKMALAGMK